MLNAWADEPQSRPLTEQDIKSALDGTFLQWDRNECKFIERRVRKDYIHSYRYNNVRAGYELEETGDTDLLGEVRRCVCDIFRVTPQDLVDDVTCKDRGRTIKLATRVYIMAARQLSRCRDRTIGNMVGTTAESVKSIYHWSIKTPTLREQCKPYVHAIGKMIGVER